jgi:predicted NBD/HSP70 family sugar kinase
VAGTQLVRHINQARALELLRRHKGLSRAQLARRLGLTKSTVSDLTNSLLAGGLVVEDAGPVAHGRGGRPGLGLRLNPVGASFLGAELGNDHIAVVALRLDARELTRVRQPIDPAQSSGEIAEQLVRLVKQVLADIEGSSANVHGLGVSVPGMLDRDGSVLWLPRLHWHDVDLTSMLERELSIRVSLENDANAAALAEMYFGRSGDAGRLLYMQLDTGVGCGLIVNRGLYVGVHGRAGEAGHLRVDPAGPRCECGGTGCLETMLGEAALLRYDSELGGEAASTQEVIDHAIAGKPVATAALERWEYWLTRGVASLIYLFDVDRIVLGGPLPAAVPDLADHLLDRLRAQQIPQTDDLQIFTSEFGSYAGAIGGAALIYQRLFQIPHADEDGFLDDDLLATL